MNTSFLLAQTTWNFAWIVGVVVGIVVLVLLLVIAQFFRLWLQAYMSNADVSLFDLIGRKRA